MKPKVFEDSIILSKTQVGQLFETIFNLHGKTKTILLGVDKGD